MERSLDGAEYHFESDVPKSYWEWSNNTSEHPVFKTADNLVLLLSDHSITDNFHAARSLARASVLLSMPSSSAVGDLKIHFESPIARQSLTGNLTYRFDAKTRAEKVELSDIEIGFNSIEMANMLREEQHRQSPIWLNESPPIKEPLLWGFMPVQDGWAQLPFMNLNEQIYLQTKLTNEPDETSKELTLINGAVIFGNDYLDIQEEHKAEQPWNVTIIDAGNIRGEWVIDSSGKLSTIELTLERPRVSASGLVWLSTEFGTSLDALPSGKNWITALKSITLTSFDVTKDVFPSPIFLKVSKLEFSPRGESASAPGSKPKFPGAKLGGFEFSFDTIPSKSGKLPNIFDALTKGWIRKVEKKDGKIVNEKVTNAFEREVLSKFPPLIWRRHPWLPAISNLALTQANSAIAYAGPNRQLAPFQMNLADNLPCDWSFILDSSNKWPECKVPLSPSSEWLNRADLEMVSLSIPGVVFDKRKTLQPELPPTEFLPLTYRYDLPYCDEINAKAQLAPKGKDDEIKKESTPIARAGYSKNWQELSKLSTLSQTDGAIALDKNLVRNLVEPYIWETKVEGEFKKYPGSLTFSNSAAPLNSLELKGESALKGIDGHFELNGTNLRRRSAMGGKFRIVAGSLVARAIDGGLQDQRGLKRFATSRLSTSSSLVATKIIVERGDSKTVPVKYFDGTYFLTSTDASVQLTTGFGTDWKIWLKNVPFKESNSQRKFDRAEVNATLSDADINDSERLSAWVNSLNCYEWRLGSQGNSSSGKPYVALGPLHFYPLELSKAEISDEKLKVIELLGDLLLPTIKPRDVSEANAYQACVRARFEDNGSGLMLTDIQPSGLGEQESCTWRLGESEDGGSIPRISWQKISLTGSASGSVRILKIDDALVSFERFGARWQIPLKSPLEFGGEEQSSIFIKQDLPISQEDLAPIQLEGTIALKQTPIDGDDAGVEKQYKHRLDLCLRLKFDTMRGVATPQKARNVIEADFWFSAFGSGLKPIVKSCSLFEDINLLQDVRDLQCTQGSLQFQWDKASLVNNSPIFLFPGMQLEVAREYPNVPESPDVYACSGFAAVCFSVEKTISGDFISFTLNSAFAETLFTCKWGALVSKEAAVRSLSTKDLAESSAGRLVVGYNLNFSQENKWTQSVMISGVMEVTNIVSWPLGEIASSVSDRVIKIPKVTVTSRLNHIRHRIRAFFNQHIVPSDILRLSGQNPDDPDCVLFTFPENRVWRPTVLVENILLEASEDIREVDDAADLEEIAGKSVWTISPLASWTSVQQLRIFRPSVLSQYLTDWQSRCVMGPVDSDSQNTLSGIIHREFSRQLLNKEVGLKDPCAKELNNVLLIEATTPSWICKNSFRTLAGESRCQVQALPNGLMTSVLSTLEDYTKFGDEEDGVAPSKWTWIMLPFLGRMQEDTDALGYSGSALRTDFIYSLIAFRAGRQSVDPLIQSLCNWDCSRNPLSIDTQVTVSPFDKSYLTKISSLDNSSLEESWFRLHALPVEKESVSASNIMFSNASVVSALTRPEVLSTLIDPERLSYPPVAADREHAESLLSDSSEDLYWGERSYLVPQYVARINRRSAAPYPFIVSAISLEEIRNEINSRDQQSETTRCFTSATVIPSVLELEGSGVTVKKAFDETNRRKRLSKSAIFKLKANDLSVDEEYVVKKRGRGWIVHPVEHDAAPNLLVRQSNRDFQLNPLRQNSSPLSLAVSPYRSIGFVDTLTVANAYEFRFILVELLCQKNNKSTLKPIAHTRLDVKETGLSVEDARQWCLAWAQRTQESLCPDSPTNILRMKKLLLTPDTKKSEFSPISVQYEYRLLKSLVQAKPVVEPSVSIRGPINKIHFAEGLFGGTEIPDSLPSLFELAPPMVHGVQPVYLQIEKVFVLTENTIFSVDNSDAIQDAEKAVVTQHLREKLKHLDADLTYLDQKDYLKSLELPTGMSGEVKELIVRSSGRSWPVNISALRYSVQYTQSANENGTVAPPSSDPALGVVGRGFEFGSPLSVPVEGEDVDTIEKLIFWWQSFPQVTQFRSKLSDSSLPTGSIPEKFRASAMFSLLPSPPGAVLPSLETIENTVKFVAAETAWQPVLPGRVHLVVQAARPGTMNSLYSNIQRQLFVDNRKSVIAKSATIPVQHRIPRPLPIPRNTENSPDRCIQTWSSFFEPTKQLAQDTVPFDDAFFAGIFDKVKMAEEIKATSCSIRIKTAKVIKDNEGEEEFQFFHHGEIPLDWDGSIKLIEKIDGEGKWKGVYSLTDNGMTIIDYPEPNPLNGSLRIDSAKLEALQNYLKTKRHGDLLTLSASLQLKMIATEVSTAVKFPS
ncbi:MAG: hypothetical protein IPP97_26650 [Candidatus Obscuribacter sp.]|nr:hypothetical protein [Candidatus Obscuribacter sp.]